MNIGKTFDHIVDSTKQVFVDIKTDFNTSLKNFRAAPEREKAWVLFKVFCVAIACGLISSVVIGGGTSLFGVVIGGSAAFYRFAKSARTAEQLAVKKAVHGVKKALDGAKP